MWDSAGRIFVLDSLMSRSRAKSGRNFWRIFLTEVLQVHWRSGMRLCFASAPASQQDPYLVKDLPAFNVPTSVFLVIVVIILVHVIRLFLPSDADLWLLFALSFVPARYAVTTFVLPGGDLASVTSFVSYMFVHGDAMHLIVNCLWLLAFGSAVAKRAGDLRFALFSVFCGVVGALTHLVVYWGDLTPVVGASAAISGLMAAAVRFMFSGSLRTTISDFQQDPTNVPLVGIADALKDPRMLIFLVVWMGLNLLFGLGAVDIGQGTAIAWEAHFGGFFAGLFGYSLFDRRARNNFR